MQVNQLNTCLQDTSVEENVYIDSRTGLRIPFSELFYWDKARVEFLNPEIDSFHHYLGMKLLASAWLKAERVLQVENELKGFMKVVETQDNYPNLLDSIIAMRKAGFDAPAHLRQIEKDLKLNVELLIMSRQDELALGVAIPVSSSDKMTGRHSESGVPNGGFDFMLNQKCGTPPPTDGDLADDAYEVALKTYIHRIGHAVHTTPGITGGLLAGLIEEARVEILTLAANKALESKINARLSKVSVWRKLLPKAAPNRADELTSLISIAMGEVAVFKDAVVPQIKVHWEIIDDKKEIIKSSSKVATVVPEAQVYGPLELEVSLNKKGPALFDSMLMMHGERCPSMSQSTKLVRQYGMKLRGVAGELIAASLPGFPEAKDLVQEGFLKLLRNKLPLDQGLLSKCIRERFGNIVQSGKEGKRNLMGAVREGTAMETSRADETLESLWDLDFQDVLRVAEDPNVLTDIQFEVFQLCCHQGISHDDASEILGKSRPVIAKTCKAILKSIRKVLVK